MMEEVYLTNKAVYPADDIIFALLGKTKVFWKSMLEDIETRYPGSAGEWNFYNDGKRWLFKMVYRKKTVFWASVLKDAYRITFYLSKKGEPLVENSDIPDTVKEEFRNAKPYGAIRPLTLIVRSQDEIEIIKKAIDIKISLK
jgi:hypothetical protein